MASANWLAAAQWGRQGTCLAALLAAALGAHAQQGTAGMSVAGAARSTTNKVATAPAAVVPQALVATSWSAVAPLGQARSQHAAVVLGNAIYVWGGYNGNSSSTTEFSSLEIYNALTDSWQSGASAPIVMRGQAGAVGADGFAYSFGGAGAANSTSFRYNPGTNTWAALAAMPTGEWEAGAATGNDGKIYVLGGESNGTANQIYNPTTNTWATGAAMPTNRHGEVVVKDASGLLHAIGGITNSNSTALTTHEVYNPATNTWTTAAELPAALNQAGGTLGSDGNLYVVGGKIDYYNNTAPFYNTVYIYSPITKTWTQGTNLPMTLGETKAASIGTSVYTVAGTNGAQQNVVYRTSLAPPCNPNTNTPVAGTDNFTAGCGPITVTAAQLLANDTSPNGTPLAIGSVSGGPNGSVVDNGNNTSTFTPFPGYTGPASFTYLLPLSGPVFASAVTGHYYELVTDANRCWTAANAAAAARTYNGLQGYLATITSPTETNLLKGRNPDNIWFGAADDDLVEGEWRWKTGPEAGTLFYLGNGTTGGATVPGQYSNWSSQEPNDYKNQFRPIGEDYGHMYGSSGLWNDLSDCAGGSATAGYFVEYGGLESCTPVRYSTGTVTVTVGGVAAHGPAGGSKVGTSVLEAAPNPSNGPFKVRVVAGVEGPAPLDLFDLQGRRISSLFSGSLQAGEPREVSVNQPTLASGLYMVRLPTGAQVQYVRVAIDK